MSIHKTLRPASMLVALVMLLSTVACAQPKSLGEAASPQRHTQWLDRPWELRYVLYVDKNWGLSKALASRLQDKEGPDEQDRRWQTIFDPTHFLPSREKWASPPEFDTKMPILRFWRSRFHVNQRFTHTLAEIL